MSSPTVQALVLAGAGVLGGTATSAGAIATLITYPALLAVGIPALAANVSNSVAVATTGIGATLASRAELQGTRRQLVRWSVAFCAGTGAGVALLLSTSPTIFAWAVPFLVAAGALILLLQPRITAWREARPTGDGRLLLPLGLLVVGVYNGYFGAGSGIMTLALILLTAERVLPRANALKNVLIGIADILAAVPFIAFGPVHWDAVVPLGIGFLVGGTIGPSITRRVPTDALRRVIAVAGLGLAAWLLASAARG